MTRRMAPSYVSGTLPPGAKAYLRADNPLLTSLKSRYAAFMPATPSQWSKDVLKRELDLRYFRGDNVYNWQVRGGIGAATYAKMAAFARRIDRLGLWDRLTEDSLFGAHTFMQDGRCISRDLLDSIIQINFLEKHTGLWRQRGTSLLDIGAGYGRLAWRLSQGMPALGRLWCADAIAESTFLCDYYLRYRGAGGFISVVPLDELEGAIAGERIDVALAIHSLSECPLAAIEWWLRLLAQAAPRHLLIVPNTKGVLLTMEREGSRLPFQPAIERHGYRLALKQDLFHGAPELQVESAYMGTELWLFERG